MATCTEEDPKRKSQPQLVKLNKALKLAEHWVSNMSKFFSPQAEHWVSNMSKSSVDEKSTLVDFEGRPSRLGIGATVPKEAQLARSDNPVERKLLATLNANKRKAITRDVDLARDGNNVDEDSEEEDSESKTKCFGKRPHSFNNSSLLNRKKRLDNRLIVQEL